MILVELLLARDFICLFLGGLSQWIRIQVDLHWPRIRLIRVAAWSDITAHNIVTGVVRTEVRRIVWKLLTLLSIRYIRYYLRIVAKDGSFPSGFRSKTRTGPLRRHPINSCSHFHHYSWLHVNHLVVYQISVTQRRRKLTYHLDGVDCKLAWPGEADEAGSETFSRSDLQQHAVQEGLA